MPKIYRWLWVSLVLALGQWALLPQVNVPKAWAGPDTLTSVSLPAVDGQVVRVAVIGDYGINQASEVTVADLVNRWRPDLVITVGDNNYPVGAADTIDANIGQYYARYIYPYAGLYGNSQAPNRFFPALGNHDWYTANAQPYLDYFTLPGNERYYNFTWGPVEFFAIDSDPNEPAGVAVTSTQALWLQNALSASTTPWQLVYFHHAAYSSSSAHGSNPYMQWPFAAWGADGVLAGHDHDYERILRDNIVYFVVGTGGASLYGFATTPVTGSAMRYNLDYGAMLITATPHQISYQFISQTGQLIDTYTQTAPLARLYIPWARR